MNIQSKLKEGTTLEKTIKIFKTKVHHHKKKI